MPSFDEAADGLTMPVAQAMETQRAVRRLRADPVDDDTVLRCVELALRAPSAGNRQSWEWIVVRDPDVKHQLARLNRQSWSIYKRLGRRRPHPFSQDKIAEAVQWQADHFEEVPVVVVACLRGSRPLFPPAATASFYASIYPSVQNLLLAARSLNLGASLTTIHTAFGAEVDAWLGLPEGCPTCAMLPIGWPLGRYRRPDRRPIDGCLFFERYQSTPLVL